MKGGTSILVSILRKKVWYCQPHSGNASLDWIPTKGYDFAWWHLKFNVVKIQLNWGVFIFFAVSDDEDSEDETEVSACAVILI